MKNRYQMTTEDNIFFAKRIIVDSIYQQANLEGIAVTFAQTQDILNNINVDSLAPNEISKVCCLRDGWQYLFDNLNKELSLIFLEEIHELIARFDVPYQNLGKWRSDDVIISGTRWRPELPNPEDILKTMNEIDKCENETERAIKMGLWIMRCQPFKDGNKRVGSFVTNKILIENGVGIFNVPVKLDGIFKQMLVDYYESNDSTELSEWIWKNCLDGTNEM
ncbi:MAG: Fic family protein [Lachnospiraceae bacterium]